MKIYLTNEKIGKLKSICAKLIKAQKTTTREVSRALGYMVSSFPRGHVWPPLLPSIKEGENSSPQIQQG